MTPPTLVSWNSAGFTGTTQPKTVSITCQAGDLLVAGAVVENDNASVAAPTGGTGLTWTQQELQNHSQYAPVYLWTAPVTSSQTFTASMSRVAGGSTIEFGFGIWVVRNHNGIGAHSSTNALSGAPSLALTTTSDNSLILAMNSDWNGVTGTATWRSVNGSPTVDLDTLGQSRYYAAHYGDAGTAGAKTVGLTAPTGQKYQIAAIEILGTTPAAGVQPSAGFFGSLV